MKKDRQWRIRLNYFRQRYGLIISLMIAILISIFLSVQLWQTPGHVSQKRQITNTQQEEAIGKNLGNVYSLSKLTFNGKSQNLSVLDYQTVSSKLISRVKGWHLKYKGDQKLSKNAYLQSLSKNNMIVMSFSDSVSGSVIKNVFGKDIKIANNVMIDHVRLPQGGTNVVLYNDAHHKIYHYQGTDVVQTIKKVKSSERAVSVDYRWIGEHVVTAPIGRIQLQTHSYLLDSDDTMSQLLKIFPDGGKRTVANDQEILTYTNGDNQRMTRNMTTGIINYDAYGINDHVDQVGQRQRQGYQWLVDLHQLTDDLYYFEETNNAKSLMYRLFVNGLPVFNQTDNGTVQVKQKTNQHEQIILSQYSLRVPLPTDNKSKVTLPTMDEEINKLMAAGVDKTDIQKILLGYRWRLNPKNQIVILEPTWYFEQDNVWRSVDSWLADKGGQ
ncbi:MAG: two-component system activity regulator YycH [Weissella hellenica]|uniref:two-component system activity regulator YycH n=1 Tax=Weissella hellenica TaxID=46256 RepID=UPI003F9D5240